MSYVSFRQLGSSGLNVSVVGLNNTVTYRDGDPKINDTGSNNSVSKG